MDRNSRAIITVCAVSALIACLCLTAWDRQRSEASIPSLECSVDDTLTFVAYDVRAWDMQSGTLTVDSEEGGKSFVMARTVLAGETCREVWGEG